MKIFPMITICLIVTEVSQVWIFILDSWKVFNVLISFKDENVVTIADYEDGHIFSKTKNVKNEYIILRFYDRSNNPQIQNDLSRNNRKFSIQNRP